MKETYDIPLISSIFEPLEKLRISGGYGGQKSKTKKRIKEERRYSEVEEEKDRIEEERESENLVDITI
jgi:hypothetical protein